MADDQNVEQEYEYQIRNRVFRLGHLTIDFHGDPESVECACTRVLLNSKGVGKRKNGISVPYDLYPIVDRITFPAPAILDRAMIKGNAIGNNLDEITADSTVNNSDENHLISTDSDEEASSCCFLKIIRSIRKKMCRKEKRKAVKSKENVEESKENVPVPISEEPTVSIVEERDDVPEEWDKLPENGITHMGFAYEKPKSTTLSEINWEYDMDLINRWNASLTLQKANEPSAPKATIDWWNAGPEHYRRSTPQAEIVEIDEVLEAAAEPDAIRKNNKKKKKKKKSVPEPEVLCTEDEKIESIPEPQMIGTKVELGPPVLGPLPRRTAAMPDEILADPSLRKYWNSRYRLFSKFDQGIQLDAESWYSVTPEAVSKHIADRCRCDVIVDGFCGAGGNTIQFAFTCERVIAIDIDPKKIELAKHNARIYGVADRIEFIVGDFFEIVPHLKADVVFLSPPWGGPSYNQLPTFPLEGICPPYGGAAIFEAASCISENVAYFLPRNINMADLMPLGQLSEHNFEAEQNIVTTKLVAVTAYFGELPIPSKT